MTDENTTADSPAAEPPTRITPVDVQQKQFRLAFRGYHEREVDEFLDQVTEELARLHAENRRLQDQLDSTRGSAVQTGPTELGDAVMRAQEQAARLLSEAEARAAAMLEEARARAESVGGSAPLSGALDDEGLARFLGRERDFLQSLAGLIQDHAESVKREVRTAKEAPPASESWGSTTMPQTPEVSAAVPWPGGPESEEQTADEEIAATSPGDLQEEEPVGETPGAQESSWAGATPAEGVTPPAQPEQPETEPASSADLTGAHRRREDEPEPGVRRAWPSEQQSDEPGEGGLDSVVFEQPTLWGEADPVTEPRVDSTPSFGPGPEVDDSRDSEEDRSLRELFWGEES
jgi:cell division initiation protein